MGIDRVEDIAPPSTRILVRKSLDGCDRSYHKDQIGAAWHTKKPFHVLIDPGTFVCVRPLFTRAQEYVFWKLEDHGESMARRHYLSLRELTFYFREPDDLEQGLILLQLETIKDQIGT